MTNSRTIFVTLRAVALAGALVGASGCRLPLVRTDLEVAQRVTRKAERMSDDGSTAKAIDFVRSKLFNTPDDFSLYYTLGWLEARLASERPAESIEHLEAAEGHYRSALVLRPDHPQSNRNLGLVLRDLDRSEEAVPFLEYVVKLNADDRETYAALLTLGDIAVDDERILDGFTRYARAFNLSPDEVPAPWRITSLHIQFPEILGEGVKSLFDYSVEFEERGFSQIATFGFQALVQRCNPPEEAAEALVHWTRIESIERAFSTEGLRPLIDSSFTGAPLTTVLEGWTCEAVQEGLADLVALASDPVTFTRNLAIAPDEAHFWNLTPERRRVLSLAMQCTAELLARGERIADAADIYENGIRYAPGVSRYQPGGALEGVPDVGLDMALDLAILYHSYRPVIDSDRARLQNLVQRPPLVAFSEASLDRLQRTPEELERVHTVLGLVFGDVVGWKSTAQYHVEKAQENARGLRGRRHSLPHLSRRVAEGLGDEENPVDPLTAYIRSARGYIELDDLDEARELYDPAYEILQRTEDRMLELEKLLYPHRGWYIGGGFGRTNSHESSSDLEGDVPGARVDDLDDTNTGYKGFVGYGLPLWDLAIEGGYTSLEGHDSAVAETGSPSSTFADDVADNHPITGEGWTLALLWQPLEYQRWSTGVKAGVWHWEADVDLNIATAGPFGGSTERRTLNNKGYSLFGGVNFAYRAARRFTVRVEYERYLLKDDGYDDLTDLISLNLLYKF